MTSTTPTTLTTWRGITLYQPWASLVRPGYKQTETRGWPTPYRGPLMIQAAKNRRPSEPDDLATLRRACRDLGLDPSPLAGMVPRGSVVAIAWLADCEKSLGVDHYSDKDHKFGDVSIGRYVWHLQSILILPEPIHCRGYQQMWTPLPDVIARVEAQVGIPEPPPW